MDFLEDYEVIEIETPELLTLQLPLAGFGPRTLAFFLDSLIIGVAQTLLAIVLFLVASAAGMFQAMQGQPGGMVLALVIIFVIVVLLVYPGYFIVFESIWNGQTPGKRLTGIRVLRRGGLPLDAQAIWMRNLMRLVDMLPSNHFVGLISFFASSNQQRVGDLVADTVVVREFSLQQPVSWVRSYGGQPQLVQRDIGTVTPRVALAINNYLMRAMQFEPELRHNLSGRLISALGYSPDTLSQRQRDEYLASVLSQFHSSA